MSVRRFREPQFWGSNGNRPEPCPMVGPKFLVAARCVVPGTARNRPESNGSRFFPSLDGNRDQDRLLGRGPMSDSKTFSARSRTSRFQAAAISATPTRRWRRSRLVSIR